MPGRRRRGRSSRRRCGGRASLAWTCWCWPRRRLAASAACRGCWTAASPSRRSGATALRTRGRRATRPCWHCTRAMCPFKRRTGATSFFWGRGVSGWPSCGRRPRGHGHGRTRWPAGWTTATPGWCWPGRRTALKKGTSWQARGRRSIAMSCRSRRKARTAPPPRNYSGARPLPSRWSPAARMPPPGAGTLHRLQAAGAGIWRTDTQGAITVFSDGHGPPTVTAARM